MKTPDYELAIQWLHQEQAALVEGIAQLQDELHIHVTDLALMIGSTEHEKKLAKKSLIEALVAELEVNERTLGLVDYDLIISELTERQAAQADAA
ncbi:MAG: hypothetical protein HN842_08210 [Gammaproteobacteria bacterium]|jgi:hypothetical protein|nr:hypothetical protein [Gammaproteobacteria bacterium]